MSKLGEDFNELRITVWHSINFVIIIKLFTVGCTVVYELIYRTKKFSCKLPEPFSSGTLRNEARGNLTEDS